MKRDSVMDDRYYTQEEYAKLTNEQKTQLYEIWEKKRSKTNSDREVSGVSTESEKSIRYIASLVRDMNNKLQQTPVPTPPTLRLENNPTTNANTTTYPSGWPGFS